MRANESRLLETRGNSAEGGHTNNRSQVRPQCRLYSTIPTNPRIIHTFGTKKSNGGGQGEKTKRGKNEKRKWRSNANRETDPQEKQGN